MLALSLGASAVTHAADSSTPPSGVLNVESASSSCPTRPLGSRMSELAATRLAFSGSDARVASEGYAPPARHPINAFNPSVYDEGDSHAARFSLVRVAPKSPDWPPTEARYSSEFFTVLVNLTGATARAPVVATLPASEDARAVLVGGVRYATFSRYNVTSGGVDMHVARLHPGPTSVRPLRFAGARATEKSWAPFVHNDTAYFTYSFCPRHVVLRCEMGSGACALAHESLTPAAICASGELRGGSGAVRVGERFVGVLHRHPQPGAERYEHAFYALGAEPPFALHALSDWFTFPDVFDASADSCVWGWEGGVALNRVQFASGLARVGDDLQLSWGAGDCEAYTVRVAAAEALEALRCSAPARAGAAA